MEIRNSKYITEDNMVVDCEVDHPEFGWIPTTVKLDGTDDREELVLQVQSAAVTEYAQPLYTVEDALFYIKRHRALLVNSEDRVVEFGGAFWQANPESLSLINNALTTFSALGSIPEGYVWRDADDVNHPLTLELLAGIASMITLETSKIYSDSWAAKEDVLAATTQEEVSQILNDYLNGEGIS